MPDEGPSNPILLLMGMELRAMTADLRPRLRILQMVESDGPGGAETMILQLSLELRRRGHTVELVGPPHGTGWLAAQLERRGMVLHTFSLRRPLDPGCYRGLKDLMQRLEIQVVHSHDFTMAVYGAAAARSLGRRHVITFHGGLGMLARWRRRVAIRWAMRASTATVAVSGATRRIYSARLGISPDRFAVIPNGISVSLGRSGADSCGTRPPRWGAAGPRRRQCDVGQGSSRLVQALAQLIGAEVPWRLVIAGDERDAAAPIRALLAGTPVQDRVRLLGLRDDVPDLLAAADIFAMPSLSEGLPLALLEAMFAGRAIVASAVGGIPEVITNDREGLLVPPSDPGALAAALRRLLDDPALRIRLGRAAQVRSAEHFTVGAMADAYERLYFGIEVPAAAR